MRQKECREQTTSANRVTADRVRPRAARIVITSRSFALDRELDLPFRRETQGQLDAAMKGHIVAQGELMGRYSRKK